MGRVTPSPKERIRAVLRPLGEQVARDAEAVLDSHYLVEAATLRFVLDDLDDARATLLSIVESQREVGR